jgi:TIGR03009 family protein
MTPSALVTPTTLAPLAAWLVALSCVSPVFAQIDAGIAPKTDQGRVPRPNGPGTVLLGNPADAPRVAEAGVNSEPLKKAIPPGYKVSPELESLLTAWEKKSQGVERLNGSFRLFTYDEVFQTETRATGLFWYASPDKGKMEFKPADLSRVPRDKVTGKLINPAIVGPNKAPYEVKGRTAETWNCNGAEILQIFPEEKKYNRIAIPQQYQGESIKESPLPFLFGLKKDEAKERYLMQIGPRNGQLLPGYKVASIHVIAYPLREADSREWSKAEVLLDSQTFLPQAIQTLDPAGTSRNAYAFSDVEVNAPWVFKNPFNVSVAGYSLIHDKPAQPQQSSAPVAPAAPKSALLK